MQHIVRIVMEDFKALSTTYVGPFESQVDAEAYAWKLVQEDEGLGVDAYVEVLFPVPES